MPQVSDARGDQSCLDLDMVVALRNIRSQFEQLKTGKKDERALSNQSHILLEKICMSTISYEPAVESRIGSGVQAVPFPEKRRSSLKPTCLIGS